MPQSNPNPITPPEPLTPGPDPAWRSLYRAGGISAILYVLLGIIVPGALFLTPEHCGFRKMISPVVWFHSSILASRRSLGRGLVYYPDEELFP